VKTRCLGCGNTFEPRGYFAWHCPDCVEKRERADAPNPPGGGSTRAPRRESDVAPALEPARALDRRGEERTSPSQPEEADRRPADAQRSAPPAHAESETRATSPARTGRFPVAWVLVLSFTALTLGGVGYVAYDVIANVASDRQDVRGDERLFERLAGVDVRAGSPASELDRRVPDARADVDPSCPAIVRRSIAAQAPGVLSGSSATLIFVDDGFARAEIHAPSAGAARRSLERELGLADAQEQRSLRWAIGERARVELSPAGERATVIVAFEPLSSRYERVVASCAGR
jgi:hypothetical protein